MIADDPFTDDDFRDRLGKLLRLLASDQPAEAEAARRKLLDHLAHHGLSLSDLTLHLGDASEPDADLVPRETLLHAEARAVRAEMGRSAADGMNSRLLGMVGRARRQTWTAWTVSGGLAAILAGVGVLSLFSVNTAARLEAGAVRQIAPRVSDSVQSTAAAPARTRGARTANEWIGTLQLDAELLDDPDSAAQRRAMLAPGTRVLVLQTGPVWLRVRSERGDGYVLKGLVRPDR